MLRDVTKGMDAAGEAMSVARIGMLKTLYAEQHAIVAEFEGLSKKYEAAKIAWRASPPADEVKNYMALRAIEKECNEARSRLNSFKAKVESVTAGCTSSIAKSGEIKGQGKETRHRISEKRMPDQHALTQLIWQHFSGHIFSYAANFS